MTSEEMIRLIRNEFTTLFEQEGFQIAYKYERHAPSEIRIGLESNKQKVKLLFIFERLISLYLLSGEKSLKGDGDWFYFEHLVDFILHQSLRDAPAPSMKNYNQFIQNDLIKTAVELKKHKEKIFSMFRDENAVKQWESDFRSYVHNEVLRKLGRSKSQHD